MDSHLIGEYRERNQAVASVELTEQRGERRPMSASAETKVGRNK